jgi:hypothetical protein
MDPVPLPEARKIFIYSSQSEDCRPIMVKTKTDVNSISDMLKELSILYSPMKSKFIKYCKIIQVDSFIENNSRICIREDGVWSLKGRFSRSVKSKAAIPWAYKDGAYLDILAVSSFFYYFL